MPSPADLAIARQSILFSSLPGELAETLMARAAVEGYARGDTICRQDDPADFVHVVLAGWVKLYRVSPGGAEAVVGVFTRGRSFGEAVALRGETYPVTAEAVTGCRLMQVRAALILGAMEAHPELCMAMLAATFRHLQGLVAQVEQLKAQTGAQRVAEFLLDLCPAAEGACTVRLPYDKVLIAGRLGMKPESLSRAFARLRDSGVRVTHNHAAIADVARLRQYAEEDRAAAWSKAQ